MSWKKQKQKVEPVNKNCNCSVRVNFKAAEAAVLLGLLGICKNNICSNAMLQHDAEQIKENSFQPLQRLTRRKIIAMAEYSFTKNLKIN